jgi:hypothetical protein
MTKFDLRLKYKRETGNMPVRGDDYYFRINDLEFIEREEIIDYIDWLEEQLIKERTY